MARTIVSNLMFTASSDAISASMAAHQAASVDHSDPEFIEHKAYVENLRWTQLFRSCNDGNPNHPRYVG